MATKQKKLSVITKRRLTVLADFLQKRVRPDAFDFGIIFIPPNDIFKKSKGIYLDPKNPKCGSVGCAVGWAPSIPSFQKAGWRRATDGLPVFQAKKGSRVYEDSFQGMERFLGLAAYQVSHLFSPYDNNGLTVDSTPKDVAKNIRKFIRKEGRVEE